MAASEPSVRVSSAGPLGRSGGALLGRPLRAWQDEARDALGFPCGLVVGAGHQCEWWHPGIGAKFMHAATLAGRSAAECAWLVIDTDIRDPAALRIPVRTDGGTEDCRAATVWLGRRGSPGAVPARRDPWPAPQADLGGAIPALPSVAEGVRRAEAALRDSTTTHGLARQIVGAVATATPALGTPAAVACSSELLRTTIGAALVDHARRDPEACARAFNAALAAAPRAARALVARDGGDVELPFWTASPAGGRESVTGRTIGALADAGAPLWPRAFLTGLLTRAVLFDRFVHGTGGESYERATDRFAHLWLGSELPPFDVATATLTLPFPAAEGERPVTHQERRAAWFDPEAPPPSPGAPASAGHSSPMKRDWLDRIARAPRRSAQRRELWRAMHVALADARSRHAGRIESVEARALQDRSRAAAQALRDDRTWAMVLHPPEAIEELARRISLVQP
jgi:hypothetical protein